MEFYSQLEVWKTCNDSHCHEVSNFGNVRSIDHWANAGPAPGKRLIPGVFMTPYISKNTGYLQVTFPDRKKRSVHRLVALAFCDGHEDHLVVNHINGIKTDNRASNLEWVTHSYNMSHPKQVLGKRNVSFGRIGVHARKITPIKARNIATGQELKFDCVMDAVRAYGFDSGQISRCCYGKAKTHKGWEFQFNNHNGYPHKLIKLPAWERDL